MNDRIAVGIMQPYLFPYIGYYQLINIVDKFIIYDDVQWIKNGWINSNYIQDNGVKRPLTLAVNKGRHGDLINQRTLVDDDKHGKSGYASKIANAYRGAPYYEYAIQIIEECFSFKGTNASAFISNSIAIMNRELEINTEIHLSSSIVQVGDIKGQARVIDIVKQMNGSVYINSIGGAGLYSYKEFRSHGVSLKYIRPLPVTYSQGAHKFVPNLSIIDIMMYNSRTEIVRMLNNCEIVDAELIGLE